MDDNGDYRPGLRAIEELSVRSPLREAGLYKSEIRELSRSLHLPTWDKPSFACLASRFPYGEEITGEKLSMVDRAKGFLISMGFRQVRVRIHGNLARIEVEPEEIPAEVEVVQEEEPEPESVPEPEPEPEPEKRKRARWIVPTLVSVLAVAVVALATFIILAQVAPDFIDSLLYTPEELQIINY
jgi:hypothetical protein